MSCKNLKRVDVQVSIITAAIVIFSSIFISVFSYRIAYGNMIKSLSERVYSICLYVDRNLDKSIFTSINYKEDEEKREYKSMKRLLEDISDAIDVTSLYIAKENSKGDLVYVIGGSRGVNDYKHPGEVIKGDMEKSIKEDIKTALSGYSVLPNKIRHTLQGEVFTAYFPVYNKEKVVGVIGIEFDAHKQYDAYRSIRIMTPIIILVSCVISIILSMKVFRRVSNPNFKDIYNTDQLTGLKNRNAYDIDIKNIIARGRQKNIGIIVVDLNRLKFINDNLGHYTGDEYIRFAGKVLKDSISRDNVIYRIGGDEFVIIIQMASDEEMNRIIYDIKNTVENNNISSLEKLSMSIGYAIYDEKLDVDINNTYRRADKEMYKDKKKYYTNN